MKVKDKYYPDYQGMYPDVDISPEVLEVLRKSDRKMKYAEYDLKCEQFVVDEKKDATSFLPSREDSLDRLIEMAKQFRDESPIAEQRLMSLVERQELRRCLTLLDESEQALIHALFFDGLTERKYGKQIGMSQKNVNKHKHRILSKLYIILKNCT